MRRRWSLRFVAGLAVTTALLGGCSSKQEANDTLPSASETSSETELEPLGPPDFPVPDEARMQTDAGAETAAGYYLSLTTYAFKTLDASALRQLSRDCDFCNELATTIEADAAAGHSFQGGEVTVGQGAQVARNGITAEVYVPVKQTALQVRDSGGAEVRSQPEYVVSASVLLQWSSGSSSWVVTQVTTS